jgi:DNA-binding MarR family transcriptional regulator
MLSYKDCVVFLLAKAYQKAHATFKKRVAAYGLTPIQVLVLEAIREEEGLSAGDIGKRAVLDSATLSGVLDRLAEREWIVKETDEEDKRSLRIYLGEKAKEVIHDLAVDREKANEEILAGFSLEETVLLKRFLRDIQT